MKTLIPTLAVLALATGCKPEEEKDACNKSGNICTFAGVPQTAQAGPEDRPADKTPLFMPQDITFAPDGTAYLPDFNNHRVRQIDTDGKIHTISGTGFLGDGPEGSSATFAWNHPTGIAVDPDDPNILHVAAWHNSRINRIDVAGGATTFECGTGGRQYGGDDGPAIDAILDLPSSVAFDSQGNLYVSDQANQAIRRVMPDDTIELVAGDPGAPMADPVDATAGYGGDGGPAIDAILYAEIGQAADPSSKIDIVDDILYMADSANNTVRMIDLDSGIIDRVAGIPWHRVTSFIQDLPPASDPTAGDGGPALDAYLNNPRDVAVGIDGELYIADTDNHCVRVVDLDGNIETFAGVCGEAPAPGAKWEGEAVPATEALLFSPYGVAVDGEGNVYIADTKHHVIRVVRY